MLTLSNGLTLFRMTTIPLLMMGVWLDTPAMRWACFVLFVVAGISDYLDGWLARRWRQTSHFGRCFDPIADKLLVCSVLLMLLAFDRVSISAIVPATAILCREILISGLREYLATLGAEVPVSALAKWKTALQMTALPLLLVGDAAVNWAATVGEIALWAAATVAVATGYTYLRSGLSAMKDGAPL